MQADDSKATDVEKPRTGRKGMAALEQICTLAWEARPTAAHRALVALHKVFCFSCCLCTRSFTIWIETSGLKTCKNMISLRRDTSRNGFSKYYTDIRLSFSLYEKPEREKNEKTRKR